MAGPTRPRVALALQGGGALGAYHIGAYQALAEADLHPDWIAGISIGAINAAILAGNSPEQRVDRLDAFWQAISWPDVPTPPEPGLWRSLGSYAEALTLGQPNFFLPRLINPWLVPDAPTTEISFYDTAPLLATLPRYADFDLINRAQTRLSLGATRVTAGDLVFFDNTEQPIRAENVLASCSLPPGFPATEVDGTLYWDGGCVSNTPLDAILASPLQADTVVFLLDLWSQAAPAPTSMNDVLWRVKQIQYADRTASEIEAAAAQVNLRHRLTPTAGPGMPVAESDEPRLDLVHVVYRPDSGPIANSDAEFSRVSIAERRGAGYSDMRATLNAAPWLRARGSGLRAMVHRVVAGRTETPAKVGPSAGLRPIREPPSRPR